MKAINVLIGVVLAALILSILGLACAPRASASVAGGQSQLSNGIIAKNYVALEVTYTETAYTVSASEVRLWRYWRWDGWNEGGRWSCDYWANSASGRAIKMQHAEGYFANLNTYPWKTSWKTGLVTVPIAKWRKPRVRCYWRIERILQRDITAARTVYLR
jgi:hypothetical protein